MSILVGVAVILTLFLMLYVGARKVETAELTRKKEEEALLQSRLLSGTLQTKVQEIRRYRHDLRGFLDTVDYMSSKKQNKRIPYTSDALVDAILLLCEQQCAERGVAFTCSADKSEDFRNSISSEDMAAILQNLLSNAREAVLELPAEADRKIMVSLVQNNGLSLEVGNSVQKGVTVTFHTRKKEPQLHGLGLSIVRQIVSENGGIMETIQEKDRGWFNVKIFISHNH